MTPVLLLSDGYIVIVAGFQGQTAEGETEHSCQRQHPHVKASEELHGASGALKQRAVFIGDRCRDPDSIASPAIMAEWNVAAAGLVSTVAHHETSSDLAAGPCRFTLWP